MISTTTVSLILVIPIVIWIWLKRKYNFWKERDILTPPFKIGWGHFQEPILQRISFSDTLHEYYRFFKSKGVKHGGIYSFIFPVYIPIDLDIIKSILMTDFDHFTERGFYRNDIDDPLTATIFSQPEDLWRWLRPKFSSAYSPAKLKVYYEAIVKCAEGYMHELGETDRNAFNIMKSVDAYTMDIVGECAFGIQFDCLKDFENEYIVNGTSFFKRTLWENIKVQMTEMIPDLMKRLHICVTRLSVTQFYEDIFQKAMDYRETNNIKINDSLDILVRLRNKEQLDKTAIGTSLSFGDIVGIAYSLILGSFEATAKTVCFSLYLLSVNKDIQEKARQEIRTVMAKNNGKLSYESMSDFIYIDMIINETLRLYPPAHHLYRICTKDYQVPGTNLLLKKGQNVYIPVMGIHRDEKYYPDPDKFDPERFSAENSEKRNATTFMPFGLGPKYCLAPKFGTMQVKVLLIMILEKFDVSLNEKTKHPIELDIGNHIILSPKDGVSLNFRRILPAGD